MENLTTGMQPAFLLLIFHSVGGDGGEKRAGEEKSHFKVKRTANLEERTENEERK